MKYTCLLIVTFCFSIRAMHNPQLLLAAWQETEATCLDVHDEVIITKNPNDTFSAKHFSRPRGCKETRIDLKSVVEAPLLPNGAYQTFILSKTEDGLMLQHVSNPWYKSSVATHSMAVLATVLVMKALSL